MLVLLESASAVLVIISSTSVSICNSFYARLVDSSGNCAFGRGYPNLNYGTFVPTYFHSIGGTFTPWNFRSMELSFPGTFDPMSQSQVELSLPNTNYQWFTQTLRRPSTKFPIIDWWANWVRIHVVLQMHLLNGLEHFTAYKQRVRVNSKYSDFMPVIGGILQDS